MTLSDFKNTGSVSVTVLLNWAFPSAVILSEEPLCHSKILLRNHDLIKRSEKYMF